MSDRKSLLIVSQRMWLVSAFEEILDQSILQVKSLDTGREAIQHVASHHPDIVMLDQAVGDEDDVGGLCRELLEHGLGPEIPILVYSSGSLARAELRAKALDAGAWTVLHDPLEAASLNSLIRRFLSVSELIRTSREESDIVDPETGFLTVSGLRRVLPVLGALAVRNTVPMSFVVIGPTTSGNGEDRQHTAEACTQHVRSADLCAWLDDVELAIVAYDTPTAGARRMVDRLNDALRELGDAGDDGPLSGGIVELGPRNELKETTSWPARREPGNVALDETEFRDLVSLCAAREAMEEARQAGGGVRVATAT